MKEEPAKGEAPILLYEIVLASDPSYAPPGTSPVPVFVYVSAFADVVAIIISLLPSNSIPLIFLAVSSFVALLAFPVNVLTILGAINDALSPINFKPPAEICKLPSILLKTAAGIPLPSVSLAIDNDPDDINSPLKGFSSVPKVEVAPKDSIFPPIVTFFDAIKLPLILTSKLSTPCKEIVLKNFPNF